MEVGGQHHAPDLQDTYLYLLVTQLLMAARITQSVKWLATGYTVRESKPGMERDFPCPYRPDPRPTQPSVQSEPRLYLGGKSGWVVVPTIHLLTVPRFQMAWICTSATPPCLHRYIMGWPLSLLLILAFSNLHSVLSPSRVVDVS